MIVDIAYYLAKIAIVREVRDEGLSKMGLKDLSNVEHYVVGLSLAAISIFLEAIHALRVLGFTEVPELYMVRSCPIARFVLHLIGDDCDRLTAFLDLSQEMLVVRKKD